MQLVDASGNMATMMYVIRNTSPQTVGVKLSDISGSSSSKLYRWKAMYDTGPLGGCCETIIVGPWRATAKEVLETVEEEIQARLASDRERRGTAYDRTIEVYLCNEEIWRAGINSRFAPEVARMYRCTECKNMYIVDYSVMGCTKCNM
jgi:hypothetical protein